MKIKTILKNSVYYREIENYGYVYLYLELDVNYDHWQKRKTTMKQVNNKLKMKFETVVVDNSIYILIPESVDVETLNIKPSLSNFLKTKKQLI